MMYPLASITCCMRLAPIQMNTLYMTGLHHQTPVCHHSPSFCTQSLPTGHICCAEAKLAGQMVGCHAEVSDVCAQVEPYMKECCQGVCTKVNSATPGQQVMVGPTNRIKWVNESMGECMNK